MKMWSHLSLVRPVDSGIAIISIHPPMQSSIVVENKDLICTAWSMRDEKNGRSIKCPVTVEELSNFYESRLHSDTQQIYLSSETIEKYISAGAVVSVARHRNLDSKIVGVIISFPIEIKTTFTTLRTAYSTHLAVDFDYRNAGYAAAPIQELINWGYQNQIFTGYHQTETEIPELLINTVPIRWWFRILDLEACQNAKFKIPEIKKSDDKSNERERMWYAVPRTGYKVDFRSFDATEVDFVYTRLASDRTVITADSVKTLAKALDIYVVPSRAVVAINHLKFRWGTKILKTSTVALNITTPDCDVRKLLISILTRCKELGSSVVYLAQTGDFTDRQLADTHAYRAGEHHLSWYNSGLKVDPTKFMSILF